MTEPTRRCPLTTGPRDETMLPQELAERLAAVGAAYPAGSPSASKAALGVIVEYLLSNGCADAVEELERLVGGAGPQEATVVPGPAGVEFVLGMAGVGEAAIAVERAAGETKGETS